MADTKISNLPAATTVADADLATVVQSGTNKKSAMSVIKSYIQAAFDSIYVPLSRTLTIGGSAKTLAADRSWTTNDILEGLGSPAQGDLIARGASSWFLVTPGTEGYVLTTHSTGNNPSWTNPSGLVTGAALTKTNDTNVTLTLGGSPTTALVNAASLTLGWTGTLAASRGGTGVGTLGDITKVNDTNVTLTLGGTPTGAVITSTSFTLGWTGTLAVSRGGTGAGTLTGVVIGNGTSAFTTVTAPSGTIVGTTDTQTLTNKRGTPRITSIASNATPTVNTDNTDCVTITALATAITSMTSNLSGTPNNFDKLIFRIKDDGTARAITWGSSFEAVGVALPTTTVISKRLVVGFIYDTVTSKWGCVASAQEA